MENAQCGTCRFGQHYGSTSVRCNRYPPVETGDYRTVQFAGFPIVRKDSWCGEYQKSTERTVDDVGLPATSARTGEGK